MTGRVASEPNVTPMIDVMLVLLIIFMVVAPMLLDGIAAQPPAGVNLQAHPGREGDVTLGIGADRLYTLDKRPIDRAELPRRLREIYAGRTDRLLYIQADRRLGYDAVLDAIEVARENGVRVVGMITVQAPRAP